VFDCAFKAQKGERSIHYMGHIKMMGATQPFISGAISKTVNVPKDASVEDIEQAYLESWRLGAKAVSIYRDGSEAHAAAQHHEGGDRREGRDRHESTAEAVKAAVAAALRSAPRRAASCRTSARRSPTSSTSRATRATSPSGLFEDGMPARIFLVMAKEGSTISGFADAFAQAISYALQYGVPLQALVDKFSHVRFEPSGMTKNADVRFAKSIVDYIFRWMASKFLSPEAQYRAGVNNRDEAIDTPSRPRCRRRRRRRPRPRRSAPTGVIVPSTTQFAAIRTRKTRRPARPCGSIMVRAAPATSAATAARRRVCLRARSA
jgi:ribonucleoside-diphosphate reductase alpha chain